MIKIKTRYFIRFDALVVPPCGDVSETLTALLIASTDAEATREFEEFCYEHPTHYEGRLITSGRCYIKGIIMREG